MNYRHSFHAGNFADVVKHALLLWLLDQRQAAGAVTVLDTHAGAGMYDLTGDAMRSKEAEAGIARLMAAADRPPLIEALAAEVSALNDGGETRLYPGSPLLVASRLRADDRYIGFELRDEVQALLVEALKAFPNAEGRLADGYETVVSSARAVKGPVVLIDPPFERPDDYVRAAEAARTLARDPASTIAVWTPLKDMETFDGFVRRLSGLKVVAAEARLRALNNPMKMNGCAMVFINPPAGIEAAADQVCGWVAKALGDAGGKAEVWRP